jgi:Putative peptidoglycan binding domain
MQEPLQKNWGRYSEVLQEYYKLVVSAELSDEDAECMDKILTQAESDEVLNFLLSEINYILGQKIGLFSDENIKKYKDQQAYLREYLQIVTGDFNTCRELQKELRKRGFYYGPIDGVFGRDSRMAVKKFQVESQLNVSGIVDLETYHKLIYRSPTSQQPGE